jgi:hypothetical protein
MRVVEMHAPGDVRVEDLPKPTIQAPTDAIIRLARPGCADRTRGPTAAQTRYRSRSRRGMSTSASSNRSNPSRSATSWSGCSPSSRPRNSVLSGSSPCRGTPTGKRWPGSSAPPTSSRNVARRDRESQRAHGRARGVLRRGGGWYPGVDDADHRATRLGGHVGFVGVLHAAMDQRRAIKVLLQPRYRPTPVIERLDDESDL